MEAGRAICSSIQSDRLGVLFSSAIVEGVAPKVACARKRDAATSAGSRLEALAVEGDCPLACPSVGSLRGLPVGVPELLPELAGLLTMTPESLQPLNRTTVIMLARVSKAVC